MRKSFKEQFIKKGKTEKAKIIFDLPGFNPAVDSCYDRFVGDYKKPDTSSFIRLMSTWNEQFGALELVREKNRLGRGSNLGSQGGNLSLWGPERFFSVVGIAIGIPIIRKSPKKLLNNNILMF